MYQDDPDLDQRLTRFEARLDRFSLALHQWQQTQENGQLDGSPLVDQRIRNLEETLDREAQALRRLHEEPLQQLQAQAANLKDICATAANSVTGLGQTESRLAALQADVQRHLTELTRTLEAFVANVQQVGASSATAHHDSAAVWPLEKVVHLHDELRRGSGAAENAANESQGQGAAAPFPSHGAKTAAEVSTRGGRVLLLERSAVSEPAAQPLPATEARVTGRRMWYVAGAIAAVGLVVLGLARIESKLNEASARAADAERLATAATEQANREAAVARDEASRQITEARDSAQRAETIGAILTAPDLVRFNLTSGVPVERSSAQLLWSRTRGLVLSASRLPAAPPQATYQLWLRTTAEPVSAGVFVPDATGRATLVTDPLKVVGPVVGAEVTVEPSGGRSAPSGRTLLVRLPQG